MSTSRTITTTRQRSAAGPLRSRPTPTPPIDLTTHGDPDEDDDDASEEDGDEAIRQAEERVHKMKARKAAAAAKKKAEQEAAKKAAEEARRQKEAAAKELEECRRVMAEAATARSRRGSLPGGSLVVVEIRKEKGKGKAKAQPVGGDPDDGGDGEDDDDDEEDRAPCERCRSKKIPCQMQAGKRSSVICKPCHDAKVRCSYSGWPSTVKREGGGNPLGERIAVLESQMAQLLADNRQLRDSQIKANTYHHHMTQKLEWLVMDANRRRKTPPELPEARPSAPSKKRRRVADSDEEEEKEIEGEMEKEREEVELEEEEEEENDELAPKKARSDKGKEKEV
ncbi:hypothetical protein F5879DRAFT_994782 [Lentinula edodes]|nr:hypothetical protein F5879DRAFT_994782 [Lentinula edodes]